MSREKRKKFYVALYGNVPIEKAYCNECKTYAFVFDGILQCCGNKSTHIPEVYKRESIPRQKRKPISKAQKMKKLSEQENQCFYCGINFDSRVYRNGKEIKLKIHWDHQVPYSLTQNNNEDNFVASCHICNGIKSSLCFQTVDAARIYINNRRKDKGYNI